MTISSLTARVSYAGSGSTGPFAVPFRFDAESELQVVKFDAAGARSIVSSGSFTSAGLGNPSGGSITLDDSLGVGETLVILPNVALTQQTDYIANDIFPASAHETALDKLTRIGQQLDERVDRGVTAPENDTGHTLPHRNSLKNRLLGGDPTTGALVALSEPLDGFEDQLLTVEGGEIGGVDRATFKGDKGDKGDPGANVNAVGLFTDLGGLTIPVGTDAIHVSGYNAATQPFRMVAVAAGPATSYRAQSANGRWFENAETHLTPEMFGTAGYATSDLAAAAADQLTALNTAIAAAAALKRPLILKRYYPVAGQVNLAAGVIIGGSGRANCGIVTTTAATGANHLIYGSAVHDVALRDFSLFHKQASSGIYDGLRLEDTYRAEIRISVFDARVYCIRLIDCDDCNVYNAELGTSTEALYPNNRPFGALAFDGCTNCHVYDSIGRRLSFGFNITGDDAWAKSYFSASAATDQIALDPLVWTSATDGDTCTLRVRNEGVLPGGVAENTTYYVIKTGQTSPYIKLATSYANAIAGTAIDLTSDGTTGNRKTQFTRTLRFTAVTAIDLATEELTVDATWYSMLSTATPVVFSQGGTNANNAPGGGYYPGGTTYDTTYYVILSAGKIKLATSSANATAGTAINLTSIPAGTPYLVIGDKSVYSNNDHLSTRPLSDTANCSFVDCTVRRYRGHPFNISSGMRCRGIGCLASEHDEFTAGVRGVRAAFQIKHSYGDGSDANAYINCVAKEASIGFQMQEGSGGIFHGCIVDGAEYDGFIANSAPNMVVTSPIVIRTKRVAFRAISSPGFQVDTYNVVADPSGSTVFAAFTSSGGWVLGSGTHSGTFHAWVMADASAGNFRIKPGNITNSQEMFIVPTTGHYPRSYMREVDLTALGVSALGLIPSGLQVARWRSLTTVATDASARFRGGRVGSAGSMFAATAPATAQLGTTTISHASAGTVDAAADTLTVSAAFYALLGTGTTVRVASLTSSLPAPLAAVTTYYVILAGSNAIKLATSSANATAGTAIDLTSVGGADVLVNLTSWAQTSGGLATEVTVVGATGKLVVEASGIPMS